MKTQSPKTPSISWKKIGLKVVKAIVIALTGLAAKEASEKINSSIEKKLNG